MTGFWVALSLRKTVVEIRTVLGKWFPELVIADWDLSTSERVKVSLGDPLTDTADILFQVEYNNSEFPTGIHFDRFPGPQEEAIIQPVNIELARRFARIFSCCTICAAGEHKPDEAPYWRIIWDQDGSYLADDCDTEFGDQSGGAVKIVREISLPSFALDDSGKLKGPEY